MRDYKAIPVDLEFGPKDKRDYTIQMYGVNPDSIQMDEFITPWETPVLDQGQTSMCLDFTWRAIEEEQHIRKHGYYRAIANGYMYGQKVLTQSEGMLEMFMVSKYQKQGLPYADSFNVVGSYAECKAYFDEHITDEIREEALQNRNSTYMTCENPKEVIAAMSAFLSSGYIGITVHNNFYDIGTDGIAPSVGQGGKAGGHAMKLSGVVKINGKQHYFVQNSWGKDWGQDGYCFIPCDADYINVIRVFADAIPEFEKIEMSIGDNVVKTLKGDVIMDVEPVIINQRTLVPVRFISEIFGFKVEWYGGQGTKKKGLIKIYKEEPKTS